MKTIHKYELSISDQCHTCLPAGAIVRHVGTQNGKIMLWAEIDSEATEAEHRQFCIRGTGHPFRGNEGEFLGTTFLGELVFHVYEGNNDANS